MLKKTIEYTDYNGNHRIDDCYFNLNITELTEIGNISIDYENVDVIAMVKIFKNIILKAYGVKSSDGRRFIKSEEISNEFSQTKAFEVLINNLMGVDGKEMVDFINAIIPNIGQQN